MKLLAMWTFGTYLYRVWEIGGEFFCECVDIQAGETIFGGPGAAPERAISDIQAGETMFVGAGVAPMRAVSEALREALRRLS